MDKSTPRLADSSHANDDELFDAFTTLLNEGNEEMAVMVYCEASPLPDTLRE